MIIRLIVLTFLVLLNPIQSYAQQEFFPFVGQSNEDDINIRAGQSTSFEKLGKLKLDEQIVVVDKSYSWYKIRLPQHAKGFVSSEYVTLINSTVGEISGKRVNVRAGAGTNFSVLGQFDKGDRVAIIKHTDDEWYQIQPHSDMYGWVAEKFIKFISSDVSGFVPQEVELAAFSPEIETETEAPNDLIDSTYISDVTTEPEILIAEPEIIETIAAPQTEFYGVLTESSDSGNGYQYLLFEDGAGTFYLDGFSQLLVPFLNYRVKIEGYIKEEEVSRSLPVVVVKRIQLVL